jgi:hypothetical protein
LRLGRLEEQAASRVDVADDAAHSSGIESITTVREDRPRAVGG